MIKITVRDFIENIRKNGLPKATDHLFYERGDNIDIIGVDDPKHINNKIGSACAFGQGLINSGAYTNLENLPDLMQDLYTDTWQLNDNDYRTDSNFNRLADRLLDMYGSIDKLDEVLEFDEFDYTPYLPEFYHVR